MSDKPTVKQSRARSWVNGYTVAGTAIVIAAIIPGSTSAALMAMEGHMCYQIGKIYRGDKYTMEEAIKTARIVGLVAIAGPLVAMEAMNAIPFAGWAVKGGVAGGIIKTLGEAIIKHYEKVELQLMGAKVIDAEIMQEIQSPPVIPPPFPATGLHLLPPSNAAHANPTLEERLVRIKDLLERNVITQAEYEVKRAQVLGEI